MKRDDFTLSLDLGHELIIDNFAGGGGTSTGLERAFGRPVDIAINHDPEALAMHAINHPHTRHLCESVWDVDPIAVTNNQPVALVWLSPDCKHFSKAKGGTPVSKHIRGLAWVGMRWAALTKPRILMLENVEEFQTWGPLLVGADGTARPDPARKGKTFDSFVRQLRQHGYAVDWQEMRASDQGTPTIRKRLFLVARRDGLPITFPEPTHADPRDRRVQAGKLAPFRTAAECIDFDIPAASVFGRKKDLATNTMRRVAKGLWRHVLASPQPYIVTNTSGHPGVGADQPLPTITTGGQHMVGQPVLTPFMTEHANASNQRTLAIDEPMRTQCAQVKGGHFSLVAPAIAPLRGTSEQHLGGHDVQTPLSTVSAGGQHHALMAGHITKFRTSSSGSAINEPMPTVTANSFIKRPGGAAPLGLVGAEMVAAHIQRDMGQSIGHPADAPLATTTAGGGGKSALVSSHLVTMGYGERVGQEARTQDVRAPLGTVVAGGIKSAIVAAHLVDAGHGESSATGAKRWSHGTRDIEQPLNTVTASGATSSLAAIHLTHLTHHGERSGHAATVPLPTITAAHRGEQAMVAACMEQANGGFYEGDGRAASVPMSTVTSAGSNQRLVGAYLVKYYGEGGQDQPAGHPMHTLTTKARMGLVQVVQVYEDCLTPDQLDRARQCAALLREHLPEHFTDPADIVMLRHQGAWWALVDITLRMLKPRELFRAQGFPENYVIDEIPDPALLFDAAGKQAADPL